MCLTKVETTAARSSRTSSERCKPGTASQTSITHEAGLSEAGADRKHPLKLGPDGSRSRPQRPQKAYCEPTNVPINPPDSYFIPTIFQPHFPSLPIVHNHKKFHSMHSGNSIKFIAGQLQIQSLPRTTEAPATVSKRWLILSVQEIATQNWPRP